MTTVRLSRFAALFCGLCLLAALPGCGVVGPSKADVSGTIKLRGQPPKLAGLQIVFMGEDGSMVSAPINEDGTYKAQGVPTGEVKVGFSSISQEAAQQGAQVKNSPRLRKPGDDNAPPKLKGTFPTVNPIREDLRDPSTSNITFKVEGGKPNEFNYDLP